ncbi:LuxR C-terminal-related transcriptional regulator [Altererythrobacter sp. Z27]|uniref:LuxR C-terminal-related transcriptional regulator n=1 Tax=Altererythrobacter sp. Z27 TaxID=3461147 RepID=UPI0040450D24
MDTKVLQRQRKKAVVGDDHPLFRDALGQLAEALIPCAEIGLAESMGEVFELAEQGAPPDIFLLDLMFPGMDIPVTLPELRKQYPLASIVLISMVSDEPTIALTMQSGGDGFIHKAVSRERCIDAISRVLAGEYVIEREDLDAASDALAENLGPTLTARQRVVLDMLATNASNKLIARELGISHLTVRLHVSALLRALGVANRKDAVAKANALGLLSGG